MSGTQRVGSNRQAHDNYLIRYIDIYLNSDLIVTVKSALSGVRVVDRADATLLGSSIGDIGSIIVAIDAKTAMLKCLCERLNYLTCHDAYLLLHHSLAIPKLL